MGGVAFGFDSAWLVGDGNLYRIDPADNRVLATIEIGGGAGWPVVALGSVWVRSAAGTARVDPAANTIVATIEGGRVFGLGSFWDTDGGEVLRIDPKAGETTARIEADPGVDWEPQIAVAFGSLWVASGGEHAVTRIDATTSKVTGRIAGLSTDYSLLTIGTGFDSVWAHANAAGRDGILYRIDPVALQVIATIPVGGNSGGPYGATNIGFGGGSVWTGNGGRTISRVDPATNLVVANMLTEDVPLFVSYGFGSVWVSSDDATDRHGNGSVTRFDAADFGP